MRNNKNVLVSGASFAGLSTAFWMNKLGYNVTVVELSEALKRGGSPVNIRGNTVDHIRRAALVDQVRENAIDMEGFEFKNADDATVGFIANSFDASRETGSEEFEIERDVLLDMMFDNVKEDVEFIFNDTVTALDEVDNAIGVTFKRGERRPFDLVFGCDGIHSAVRRLWFGEEKKFVHFLGAYFSITIVNKLLISENTSQMYNEPGLAVAVNAYNNKTDIVLCFASDEEISYDYRDESQQRKIIYDRFDTPDWRVPELVELVKRSNQFYFDKLCQIKMPNWSKGRIALVGDAGYCASPAAGMGGSLAIDGAGALFNAFEKFGDDFEAAFREYNDKFRPFVEEVQKDAVSFGLDILVPRTEETIRQRNMNSV